MKDNVQWEPEQEVRAREQVARNGVVQYTADEVDHFARHADEFWNAFYEIHRNKFFKDRNWLYTEFPELAAETTKVIFDVGCGVGNTMFPILQNTKNADVFIYGCDISENAIEILKHNELYEENKCKAFVLDATSENWRTPIGENSVDVAVLIFVLSAITPKSFAIVAKQIYRFIKPGGIVLFRDYGRYDLTQLRMKAGRCIGENFYVRGDGTQVYFFTLDEVADIFQSAGFRTIEKQEDRRLQVNRGRMMTMYRVWIQAKFQKVL